MTDLQFKAYLRLLLSNLDRIAIQETAEQMRDELAKLRRDLEHSLQG